MSVNTKAASLNVRSDLTLNNEQLRAFEALECFDLSVIRDRLVRKGTLPESQVDEAIREFRRWVGLHIVEPAEQSIFNRYVDDVWHTLILHTRLYADFCDRVLGGFRHHTPRIGGFPDRSERFREFEALYQRVYGPISPIWYTRLAEE